MVALFVPVEGVVSYCGAPPRPDALWSRWNLDPLLVAVLVLIAVGYALSARRHGRADDRTAWRSGCFYLGWAIGSFALISPLCALSVSLASARVAQHMVLAAVAAPLVALGLRPLAARASGIGGAVLAATAFAAALWFWHAPAAYDATFASVAVYWTMHLTAFGAALWLWRAVVSAGAQRLAAGLAAAALTSLQMGLLGAVLTFADRPFYAPHALTTATWGLTPLADQQLAGAIMWVPAGAVLVAAVVAGMATALRDADRRNALVAAQ